jgi:hypothetical protein
MLYLPRFSKKKKNGREKQPGGFFLGHTQPSGCAMLGLPWLLGATKSYFKDQF